MNKKNVIANQHTYFACAMYKKKKWETKDYLILPELEKLVVGEGKAEQEAGNLGEQK